MPMPEITFRLKLFRGDWDQARSQLALLWLMEALCRVNQGHIRQAIGLAKKGMVKEPLPRLYRAGVHYEREPPEGEDWPDIPTILEKTGKDFPGPWLDCEDAACWRVAELRELGGIKAKPFAKWRKGDGGNYHYHALVLLPDGRLEDPSLTLGMGREKFFHDNGIIQAYKDGKVKVKVRYAEPPSVMVVDPESPSGYAGMKAEEANAKIEAKIRQSGMLGTVLGEMVRLPNIPMKDLLGVGDDLDGALGWRGDDLTPRVPMKRLERLYSMRGR